MKQSFQVGVDTLYNKCVSCGSTPSNKTPTAISNSIQSIYNNRYTEGYNAGQSASAYKGYDYTGLVITYGKLDNTNNNSVVHYLLTGCRSVTISGNCRNQYAAGTITINGETVWSRNNAYASHNIPSITRSTDPNGNGNVSINIYGINTHSTGINFNISAH